MSKRVLVLHPRFSLYGGGELLCLHTIKALQDIGYKVQLATDSFSPAQCERIYGSIGRCLLDVDFLQIPSFHRVLPRFLAYQHIRYAGRIQGLFGKPNLIFSTQSSLYYVPGVETYHFIYDLVDLSVVRFSHHLKASPLKTPYYMLLRRYRDMLEKPEPMRHFLALGRGISHELGSIGYENRLIIPPCPIDYGPLPKKNQVVKVTRIVPQKRLEEFGQIANLMPKHRFYLVGLTNQPFRNYRNNVLKTMPENVEYHEAPLRTCPELLQESKVYLYTSHEPGLPIALVQGIGAGCFPVTPDTGGGAEAVDIAGYGLKYRSLNEAVSGIESLMIQNDSGELIAHSAERFSPERFWDNVQSLAA